jgi:APA family basic amino acid/polyamine antiporter
MVGDAGGWIVAAGGLISCLGAMVGWVMMQGQIPYAAARDGLFPRPFARLDHNGSPAFGLIASNVLVTILILLTSSGGLADQFERIILIATSISLVPYGLTALALLRLLRTDPTAFERRALVKYGVIATLAAAYSIWAVIGSGWTVIWQGMVLLALGIPVYIWLTRRGSPDRTVGTPVAPGD